MVAEMTPQVPEVPPYVPVSLSPSLVSVPVNVPGQESVEGATAVKGSILSPFMVPVTVPLEPVALDHVPVRPESPSLSVTVSVVVNPIPFWVPVSDPEYVPSNDPLQALKPARRAPNIRSLISSTPPRMGSVAGGLVKSSANDVVQNKRGLGVLVGSASTRSSGGCGGIPKQGGVCVREHPCIGSVMVGTACLDIVGV